MKQYIYLDIDRTNSIIAQTEKGLIDRITSERNTQAGETILNSVKGDVGGEVGGKLFKFITAEESLNIGGSREWSCDSQLITKELIAKTLHDAAFDYAYKAVDPKKMNNNESSADPGDYVELSRIFDFVDIEYLEGLFSQNGIIEYLKKKENENIRQSMGKQSLTELNHDQRRQNKGAIAKHVNDIIKQNSQKYDEIRDLLNVLSSIVPYKRMLVSSDGYLLPLEDKYFRIDPTRLGFVYGGELRCVGVITNVIGEDANPQDDNNIFATLQFSVNEVLRSLLPTKENTLYVVTPLAIYYE